MVLKITYEGKFSIILKQRKELGRTEYGRRLNLILYTKNQPVLPGQRTQKRLLLRKVTKTALKNQIKKKETRRFGVKFFASINSEWLFFRSPWVRTRKLFTVSPTKLQSSGEKTAYRAFYHRTKVKISWGWLVISIILEYIVLLLSSGKSNKY